MFACVYFLQRDVCHIRVGVNMCDANVSNARAYTGRHRNVCGQAGVGYVSQSVCVRTDVFDAGPPGGRCWMGDVVGHLGMPACH